MKRTPIIIDPAAYPAVFRPLLADGMVYDSSCSEGARVLFLDKEGGYYLKSAPRGRLATEAAMTRFFAEKGLGAEVLAYHSDACDWLLTRRVPGEDATWAGYLADPVRLCDTLAMHLRALHELDPAACPVPARTVSYLVAVEEGYRVGRYDASLLAEGERFSGAEEAWELIRQNRHCFRCDTLLHGDYCLPNVMLDDWRFSGFIDLGNGGVGDRHIDLFWGIWSLRYNLGTDRYRERFLDAYGRDKAESDMLRIIAAAEVFG